MQSEIFAAWLDGQGYRPATGRKLLTDLRSYLRRPALAYTPSSFQRARDYAWAYTVYEEFAEETGAAALPIAAPPEPVRPEKRRRTKANKASTRSMEAVSIDARQWRALNKRIVDGYVPTDRVLEVMFATGLRVGDVLRVSRKGLIGAFGRDDGLVVLTLKGAKETLSTVHAAREPWSRLLALFDTERGSSGGVLTNVAAATSQSRSNNWAPCGPAYQAVRRRFQEHCRTAKVEGRHNLHRIRRTVAIRLRQAGASLDDVSLVLGHSSRATTRTYTDEYQATLIADTLGRLK